MVVNLRGNRKEESGGRGPSEGAKPTVTMVERKHPPKVQGSRFTPWRGGGSFLRTNCIKQSDAVPFAAYKYTTYERANIKVPLAKKQ